MAYLLQFSLLLLSKCEKMVNRVILYSTILLFLAHLTSQFINHLYYVTYTFS